MTQPIGSGRPSFPPSQLTSRDTNTLRSKTGMKTGSDARSAPVSSDRSVPMIDRSQVNPEIVKAAEGMESLFLSYMMKVMRQTVPKNEMDLESPATDIYRGMMDAEVAQKIAHEGGIGLADQVIAYLQSREYHK